MAHKQILFKTAAREKILHGVNTLAVAGVLLLTEATLTDIPEERNNNNEPRENII